MEQCQDILSDHQEDSIQYFEILQYGI